MGNCCSQRELSFDGKQAGFGASGDCDTAKSDVQQAALNWENWLRGETNGTNGAAASTNGNLSPRRVASSTLQDELTRLQSENAALRGQLGMSVAESAQSPQRSLGNDVMDSPLKASSADPKESPIYVLPGGVLRPALDCFNPTQAADDSTEWRTTVMLRNLPNNYTRDMVVAMLDSEGFAGQFDFLYLPIDFQSGASLGYSFINCTSAETAQCMWNVFAGYSAWVLPSKKKCIVSWSDPHQGLVANVDRYRNSPIMHPIVPDEHKPIVLMCGKRIPFLPPTKKLKAPRVRQVTDRRQLHSNGSANVIPTADDTSELYYPGFAACPLRQPNTDETDSWPDQQYRQFGEALRARAHSGF